MTRHEKLLLAGTNWVSREHPSMSIAEAIEAAGVPEELKQLVTLIAPYKTYTTGLALTGEPLTLYDVGRIRWAVKELARLYPREP